MSAAEMETAASFLWFAAIQDIEHKQDLAGLAPKGRIVSAEAIERIVGQIGETQKATREVSARIDGMIDRFLPRTVHGFGAVCAAVGYWNLIETARVSPPERRMNNFPRDGVNLAHPEFRTGRFPLSWRGAAATARSQIDAQCIQQRPFELAFLAGIP